MIGLGSDKNVSKVREEIGGHQACRRVGHLVIVNELELVKLKETSMLGKFKIPFTEWPIFELLMYALQTHECQGGCIMHGGVGVWCVIGGISLVAVRGRRIDKQQDNSSPLYTSVPQRICATKCFHSSA